MKRYGVDRTGLVSTLLFVAFTLSFAGDAHADFAFGTPTNLGPAVNTSVEDGGPCVSPDGLSFYFYSFFQAFGVPTVRMATRETVDGPWSEAVDLAPSVFPTGASLCFSADGLSVLFESFRSGGSGQADLWMASRETVSGPWGPPVNLGPNVNSTALDMCASISADGLAIFFQSNRAGGSGAEDIHVSTRASTAEPWRPAVNLGPIVNSPAYDGSPCILPDGLTLLFTSNRPGGFGDNDIWVTRRATANAAWGEPVNLGPPVNTARGEAEPTISPDGQTLYFSDWSAPRPGGVGRIDLWQVPILPVVDFTGDSVVDGDDLLVLVAHWGQDYPPCDVGPTPLGDGVVDLQDVIALADYIGKDVTDPTLVAHWPLDESQGTVAYDAAGDHDGTVDGSPAWRPTGGSVVGALEFDGMTFVDTESVLNPAEGPFSVFAWVKGGAPGQAVLAQTPGTRLGSTWLAADAAEGRLMTGLMSPQPPLVSGSVITDGLWHRIGLVWDGSRRHLYVDGQDVAGDALSVWAMPCDGGLHIGTDYNWAAGTFWTGLIDDVRIYNRAVQP